MSGKHHTYTVRKATQADIPALAEVTGSDESHKKRLIPKGHSYHPENSVMAVEEDGVIIGTGFLMFVRPPAWPDAEDTSGLPQIISLVVKKEYRNRGAGTFLIAAAVEEIKSRGLSCLYLGVSPEDNPGALRLYERLGFESISTEPYRTSWTYTDSDGVEREEVEWLIDMVKKF